MITTGTRSIKKTFQKISDLVTPTMGAKGRMAVIEQAGDRPLMTDDGVTVAAECMNLKGFEQMPALSMIEAARNTEREAFDGTTLTVLLTNEFYKAGLRWHLHPQARADRLERLVGQIRKELQRYRFHPKPEEVRSVATISSKIPVVGELVYQAYLQAGEQMNVLVEMDREHDISSVEHTDGMVIESGYMGEIMRNYCNDPKRTTTTFDNPTIVLLSQGVFTTSNMKSFFSSVPNEVLSLPFIFVIDKSFNPESLANLTETLTKNRLIFQMVFINEEAPDELLLDIAAFTGGVIQDTMLMSSNYLYQHCGHASRVVIEKNKTTFTGVISNPDALKGRIESYESVLSKEKFTLPQARITTITRRLSALTSGIVKIKIAASSITEFNTIRYKLDDAIGAARCALRDGAVMGAGLPLYLIANDYHQLRKALRKPFITIIRNAGLSVPRWAVRKYKYIVRDVKSNTLVNPIDKGIIDSYTSIDASLKNAVSIAASYLRAYTMIKTKGD